MQGHEDLALLTETVRAAGAIARQYFGTDYRHWRKEGGSPVTEADIAVNRFLCERLTAARPDYGWLSEESPDDPARLTRHKVFVIDPIDGTVAFLKGRPHFTVCAAVVTAGRPCCGAVYNPASDELYAARTGGGATRNGTPIQVGARAQLQGCRMLGRRDVLTLPPWPPMDVQNRNSLAYRLALVADVYDPEVIVIGGGVSESAPLFLDDARERYASVVTGAGHRPLARIRTAQLGDDAGIVGAATLAREMSTSMARNSRRS